ncbi:Hypothetical predicted protein [Paramuricea clavata]|uniref:Peptidase M20 dimerisation domain-containing protein n=1 Tax=Paramuricea clavata TaxID=317549 RepID=A0A6S7JYV2_PARCT|nr:Hypothetical predicted protein [Paramuricea clavata]
MGTPAEEGGGGKILMLEKGCFDKVDFSMMVHPTPYNAIYSQYLAVQNVYVTFKGRAAHAAAFPWEGVNALDAAVLSYNAISMLRQQIKPTWRAHGIFTEGGIEPSIIPEKTQLHYYFRAPSLKELGEFKTKAENCFRAAAEATGCSVDIKWCGHGKDHQPYIDVLNNPVLGDLYRKHAESLGIQFLPRVIEASLPTASTDMGNVSHVVPSIHPLYSITTKAGNHTHEFTKATGDEIAQSPTLIAAKSMAMTAVDILCNPEMLEQMKNKHNEGK